MTRVRTRRVSRATTGSPLAAHIAAAVDSRLAGLEAASALALFTTVTHADVGPFVRNTSFWAADLVEKLTCVSPSRTGSSLVGLGTAITPRHILYHKHGGAIPNGDTIRFVTAADVIVLRTQDQSVATTIPDFRVGLLSSDLPGTITPCPVVPDNLRDYLPAWPRYPIMVVDQAGNGLVHDAARVDGQFVYAVTSTDAQRLAFYEAIVTNDSGKAWFGLINDTLVLFAITQGFGDVFTGIGGASPAGWNAALNQALVDVDALGAVSTGYTVSNPDLSEFRLFR